MKKKWIALLLCTMMAFSLVACAGDSAGEKNTEAGSPDGKEENQGEEENKGNVETDKNSVKPKMKYQKVTSFDQEGNETRVLEYKYDEKGREIYFKQKSYNYQSESFDTIETTAEWKEDGTTATGEFRDGRKGVYKYDKDGNVIEYTVENTAQKIESKYEYKDGKKVSMKTSTYTSGVLYMVVEEVYNEYENVIDYKQTVVEQDVVFHITYEYEYDENGKFLSVTLYTETEAGIVESGKLDYVYDVQGHLDRIEVDGELHTEVTCDENGNTIEMKVYANKIVTQITSVEYYEN